MILEMGVSKRHKERLAGSTHKYGEEVFVCSGVQSEGVESNHVHTLKRNYPIK